MARKFITYFEKQGNDYTDELINAVKDKLELSDNINKVLSILLNNLLIFSSLLK